MLNDKVDYSKVDKHNLEIYFGKSKAFILIELSNLQLKNYNNTIDDINFYYKGETPYIQYYTKDNTVSFNKVLIEILNTKFKLNETEIEETLISSSEILLDLSNLIYKNNFNHDLFEVVDLTNKIRTFDDVLFFSNETIELFNIRTQYDSKYEIAFKKLVLIVKVMNEGWIPDWGDNSQYKYYPWFNMGGGGSSGVGFSYGDFVDLSVASCLCFKSRELCEYTAKQFIDIYKEYMLC